MRVYRRDDFMRLPEGVIFSKGKPWYWGGLCVKGDTILDGNLKPIDFGVLHLVGIEAHDCGELVDRYGAMLEGGQSFPMEDAYGRDGCFDNEDLFLVWERADIDAMQQILSAALSATERDATVSGQGET